jgi:hypothetical protein
VSWTRRRKRDLVSRNSRTRWIYCLLQWQSVVSPAWATKRRMAAVYRSVDARASPASSAQPAALQERPRPGSGHRINRPNPISTISVIARQNRPLRSRPIADAIALQPGNGNCTSNIFLTIALVVHTTLRPGYGVPAKWQPCLFDITGAQLRTVRRSLTHLAVVRTAVRRPAQPGPSNRIFGCPLYPTQTQQMD